jgi:hypothetical protein
MRFASEYKKFIQSEENISKNLIRPRNIYKITSYKYSDGITKSLSGQETALVFVLGITSDKKVSCIKFSLIKPDIFFKWLKRLFINTITEDDVKSNKKLEDLLIISDRAGKKLFSSFLKTDAIYNKEPDVYRTYNLSGIKSVQEITFKSDVLLKYSKIRNQPSKVDDTTTENSK